jgi:hypothetical protein
LIILDSKTFIANLKTQMIGLITTIWYNLRSPRLTLILLGLLGGVLLVGLLLPQPVSQVNTEATRAAWIANLPLPVQLWGDLLFLLGFARLFQSIWFWLPLALLLLNSLLALADYTPDAWPRLRPPPPPLERQHPLAGRAEYSTRLPESPDEFLAELKNSLTQQGFFIYQSDPSNPRQVTLARRRYAWLGPTLGYAGLVGLVLAALVSHYSLQFDYLSFRPSQPVESPLFTGALSLTGVEPAQLSGQISLASAHESAEVTILNWQLYRPAFFAGVMALPLTIEPLLTVEARDNDGGLLRLIPAQQDLAPAERLSISLDSPNQPLYFSIPAHGLAFQLTPESANPNQVMMRVRHTGESASSEEIRATVGRNFELDGLTLTISPDKGLDVLVYWDLALPLYLISLCLIGVGAVFFWWQRPLLIWFVPEVKGRGGQLYGIVEKFGPVLVEDSAPFFEQLLAGESPDK